jgi:hypothetical protein
MTNKYRNATERPASPSDHATKRGRVNGEDTKIFTGGTAVEWLVSKEIIITKLRNNNCLKLVLGKESDSIAEVMSLEPNLKEYLMNAADEAYNVLGQAKGLELDETVEEYPHLPYLWSGQPLPPALNIDGEVPEDCIAGDANTHTLTVMEIDDVVTEKVVAGLIAYKPLATHSVEHLQTLLSAGAWVDLRKEYMATKSNYEKMLDAARKPILAAGKIFTEVFGDNVLSIAEKFIAAECYNKAWAAIENHYLKTGPGQISNFTADVSNATFKRGETLEGFLANMRNAFKRLAVATALTSYTPTPAQVASGDPFIPDPDAIIANSWDNTDAEIIAAGYPLLLMEAQSVNWIQNAFVRHPEQRYNMVIGLFINDATPITARFRSLIGRVVLFDTSMLASSLNKNASDNYAAKANTAKQIRKRPHEANREQPRGQPRAQQHGTNAKRCDHHPDSSSHWTADCSITKRAAGVNIESDSKSCAYCYKNHPAIASTHTTDKCRKRNSSGNQGASSSSSSSSRYNNYNNNNNNGSSSSNSAHNLQTKTTNMLKKQVANLAQLVKDRTSTGDNDADYE